MSALACTTPADQCDEKTARQLTYQMAVLLAKHPRPSGAQLRELAQMLLDAADESDAAR